MDRVRAPELAGIVGGVLLVLGNGVLLANPAAQSLASAADYATVGIVTAGALLVGVGLVGIHLRQRRAYGRLGLIGFTLALVAQLAAAAAFATANQASYLLALAAGVIGFFLISLAIARAPVLPRWTGYLAYVGFVALVIVGDADLGVAAAGVAWLVIGYALWAHGLTRLRSSFG